MKVVLSGHEEKANCIWCQRDRECVKATFSDGLFQNAMICFKCMATAIRVRSKATEAQPKTLAEADKPA
ncbi:hypothetical protein LF1_10970 [Rubripirellula obstinata]|uniref:Uncharacterized protein n=1 Tax=Rubripirellula obstinata TaxID=406547 RepID=A0A5B1CF99_9BACT|nr:hypothetical protein [Rubripirellula obstinata]KAA1258575.1 hypothetical protein LF1_10970 [Rubripirellula obstinata]